MTAAAGMRGLDFVSLLTEGPTAIDRVTRP